MTDEELKAIEARAAAATPGPWQPESEKLQILKEHAYSVRIRRADGLVLCDVWNWTHATHDVEFIAHARTDVPALVAEVQRVTAAFDNHKKIGINAVVSVVEERLSVGLRRERDEARAEVERLRKVMRLQMERAWERGADFHGLDDVPERYWKADRDRDVAKLLSTEITDDELIGQTNG